MSELTEAEREQRAAANLQHGAHAYLARTEKGQAITDAMQTVQDQVQADVVNLGQRGRVLLQADRLGTAADLLYQHIMAGDADTFERLLPKWGWLVGAEIRARRDAAALPGDDEMAVSTARVLESLPHADTD
jgi:hypothetical protein